MKSKEEMIELRDEAVEKYSFQVPYDGTKNFYNEPKAKAFTDGWDAAMQSYASQSAGQWSEGVELEKLFEHMKSVEYPAWGHGIVMLWCHDGQWKAGLRNYKPDSPATFEGNTAYEAMNELYKFCLRNGHVEPLPVSPSKPTSEGFSKEDLKAAYYGGEYNRAWGSSTGDIPFSDWFKDFVPSKPLPVSPSKPTSEDFGIEDMRKAFNAGERIDLGDYIPFDEFIESLKK